MKSLINTPRRKRLVAAVISSAVVFFVGQTFYAHADKGALDSSPGNAKQACGLSTATRFLQGLEDNTVEQTPTYRLALAENFLDLCPYRLEAARAHEVAASAALYTGDYSKAAHHYDMTFETQRSVMPVERLKAALAHKLAGNEAAARFARNQAVYDWLKNVHDNTDANLSVTHTRNGTVYQVLFAESGETDDVAAIWMGVSRSGDMPYTVVLHNDTQRAAWAALRDRATVQDYFVLESFGCRQRDVLLHTTRALPPATQNKRVERHLDKMMGQTEDLSRLEARGGSCTNFSKAVYVPEPKQQSAALIQ